MPRSKACTKAPFGGALGLTLPLPGRLQFSPMMPFSTIALTGREQRGCNLHAGARDFEGAPHALAPAFRRSAETQAADGADAAAASERPQGRARDDRHLSCRPRGDVLARRALGPGDAGALCTA